MIQKYNGGGKSVSQNNTGKAKFVGAGIITGMIAGFWGSQMLKSNRKLRKKAGKALDSVEELIDNVQSIIG